MKDWVILFCIVACVFAAFAIVYVIVSVIRELRRRKEKNAEVLLYSDASEDRYMTTAMLCGTAFAISGLLVWSVLSKKEKKPSPCPSPCPSKSRACRVRCRRSKKR